MKRELGIARCRLACCLCSENVLCKGSGLSDAPRSGHVPHRQREAVMIVRCN